MEQIYTPTKDYKVLVRCFTYNQSKYIEDALNGFAMQKTDFQFVCLVMDDASTDGEQEVVKAWMERECDMSRAENVEIEKSFVTIVSHKTNHNCSFAFYFLKENLYRVRDKKMCMVTPWREHCEYEALCEGDDYWTDSEKLQRQVNFLDNHREYAMCFHKSVVYETDGSLSNLYSSLHEGDYTGAQILADWIVPTASVVYRSCFSNCPQDTRFMFGDVVLYTWLSTKGKIYCMGDAMSVYRRNIGGVTKMTYDFRRILNQHYAEMDYFGYLYRDIIYKRIAKVYIGTFQRGESMKTKVSALFNFLLDFRYCVPVFKKIWSAYKMNWLSKN